MYYLCSENKDADQLRGYREADMRLVFAYAKSRFSHDTANLVLSVYKMGSQEYKLSEYNKDHKDAGYSASFWSLLDVNVILILL